MKMKQSEFSKELDYTIDQLQKAMRVTAGLRDITYNMNNPAEQSSDDEKLRYRYVMDKLDELEERMSVIRSHYEYYEKARPSREEREEIYAQYDKGE